MESILLLSETIMTLCNHNANNDPTQNMVLGGSDPLQLFLKDLFFAPLNDEGREKLPRREGVDGTETTKSLQRPWKTS